MSTAERPHGQTQEKTGAGGVGAETPQPTEQEPKARRGFWKEPTGALEKGYRERALEKGRQEQ